MTWLIDDSLEQRIQYLATKNNRTFHEQILLMIETFEVMDIQWFSFLPGNRDCNTVPLVEVLKPVVKRR